MKQTKTDNQTASDAPEARILGRERTFAEQFALYNEDAPVGKPPTETQIRLFCFYALTRSERFVDIERRAKNERAARAKIRRSKFGRTLRSLTLKEIKP